MTLENIKELILNYSDKFVLRGQQSYQLTKNKLLLKEINKNCNNIFSSVQEIVYLIENINNLENLHIFCRCGKKNTFIRYRIGYRKHCSYKCSNTDPQVLKQNKENVRLAWSKKSKDEKYIISQKMLNSKNKRTLEQKKQTFERKSLATKRMWNNFTKQDIINLGNKISNAHANRTPEQKCESKLKYLKTMDSKTNEEKKSIFAKISKSLRSRTKKQLDEIYKKSYNTKVKNNTLPSSYKIRNKIKTALLNKTVEEKDKIRQKCYNTKKKNGTLGGFRSKQEIRCFELLKVKFPDAKHTYYDKQRYPFLCDVYIPSKDLFIEFHFSPYHHYKPFDKNCIGDLVELSKINNTIISPYYSNTQKDFFKNILNTWTIKDPIKLETFKKNNLNYKIFYIEKEFNEWFKTI